MINGVPTEKVLKDPRPDLTADAALWRRLFSRSYTLDPYDRYGLHGALLGVRAYGARLEPAVGTLRIMKPEGVSAEGWARVRDTYLKPHTAQLVALLKEAAA